MPAGTADRGEAAGRRVGGHGPDLRGQSVSPPPRHRAPALQLVAGRAGGGHAVRPRIDLPAVIRCAAGVRTVGRVDGQTRIRACDRRDADRLAGRTHPRRSDGSGSTGPGAGFRHEEERRERLVAELRKARLTGIRVTVPAAETLSGKATTTSRSRTWPVTTWPPSTETATNNSAVEPVPALPLAGLGLLGVLLVLLGRRRQGG